MVRDMGRAAPQCPICCGWEQVVPGSSMLSVADGGRGLRGWDVPWVAPHPLQPSLRCPGRPLLPWALLGEQGPAQHQSSRECATVGGRAVPAVFAAGAQPWPAPPLLSQGAPARERPCSCSSAPANSASSRPLSEPSKQPESRGMSTLGPDTVFAAGSWLLSAPSSASSLPVS